MTTGAPAPGDRRPATYAAAGVDVAAGARAVDRIRAAVASTRTPGVVGDLGGFGGLFSVPGGFRTPVLVSSTDGVGTKVLVAQAMGRHDTVGIDLVAMSVDDVAAQGGQPLFFLDYLLFDRLDEDLAGQLVAGIAAGCREAGCALIGGEMAEHPGHLPAGSYDLAGFCVGIVERDRVVTGAGIREGDAVIGMGSSGLHSNGYSLARRVLLADGPGRLMSVVPSLGRPLGDELLEPTTIYAPAVARLLAEVAVEVRGLVHVTGGGIPENLGRILPAGLGAWVDPAMWPRPPIFDLIAAEGPVEEAEMYRTFNMGLGMLAVVPADQAGAALRLLEAAGRPAWEVGRIVPGAGVQIRG
ncbi:MAG TPA: phosphoribosylformylglycinamidine cyclo-ligase [Actinomycetota bacterium]|nr:phosphoribosylformylglycinamidine cyclo-ligase [Actinomycetota bacterium]